VKKDRLGERKALSCPAGDGNLLQQRPESGLEEKRAQTGGGEGTFRYDTTRSNPLKIGIFQRKFFNGLFEGDSVVTPEAFFDNGLQDCYFTFNHVETISYAISKAEGTHKRGGEPVFIRRTHFRVLEGTGLISRALLLLAEPPIPVHGPKIQWHSRKTLN
jgi:hypothetical protein